jgi:hypothetical protein
MSTLRVRAIDLGSDDNQGCPTYPTSVFQCLMLQRPANFPKFGFSWTEAGHQRCAFGKSSQLGPFHLKTTLDTL